MEESLVGFYNVKNGNLGFGRGSTWLQISPSFSAHRWSLFSTNQGNAVRLGQLSPYFDMAIYDADVLRQYVNSLPVAGIYFSRQGLAESFAAAAAAVPRKGSAELRLNRYNVRLSRQRLDSNLR